MPPDEVNVYVREEQGRKTVPLKCNWCKEDHLVSPEYREDILMRGAERLAELAAQDLCRVIPLRNEIFF